MLKATLGIMAASSAAVSPAQVETGEAWIADHIEPAVKDWLIDPESARFEWPYMFTQRENGWTTCGYVNSRNRMGGYAGKAAVLVVFNPGKEPYFNIAEDDSMWDPVAGMCRKWIKDGILMPR